MFSCLGLVYICVLALLVLLGRSAAKDIPLDTLELAQKNTQNDPNESRLRAAQSEIILRSSAWQGRAHSLPDVLAEQAGIETRRYGGIGSFQTVSIRGATGSRLLVYLDGVPMNSAGGGAVDLGKINLDALDRIEIRKGLAPASEGGNGMGGVVHLYSKLGQRNAEITLGVGDFGLKRSAISAGTSNKRIALLGNLAWVKAENDFSYLDRNHTAYNVDDDKWVTRQNSAYRSLEAHTQVKFNINPKHILRFKMATSNNSGGLPGDESAVTTTAGFSNTLTQYLVGWEAKVLSEERHLNTEISLDEETPEFHWTAADHIGLTLGRDTTVIKNRSSRSRLRLQGDRSWQLPISWNLGLVYLINLGQENLKPVFEQDAGSNPARVNRRREGTLALDLTLGKDSLLQFTFGANTEWIRDNTQITTSYYGEVLPAAKNAEWHRAGRFGALWTARPRMALFFNLGRFYHMPSLGDRFGGRWGVLPNPRLHEETGLNVEGGMRQRWNSGFLEVCAFRNQINDAILYFHSLGFVKATNLDATLTQGLEITLDQKLPFGIFSNYNASFRHSENQSRTDYSGLALPDAPFYHHHFKARIPFLDKFSVEPGWEFRTEIFRDPGNVIIIPVQNLFHTSLVWSPIKRIQWVVNLQNITNTYYEDVYSAFPYPGRNLSTTLSAKI